MNRLQIWLQRVWLILVVAALIIAGDQWTKEWVRANLPKFADVQIAPLLGNYFLFQHVDNHGAAFGMFQDHGEVFVVVAAVVAAAMLIYAWHIPQHQRLLRFLLGLQLGGAVGNVIDRINQGYVTDFVKMGIPNVYYWPNYNIADSAIVIGVIGLGIYILLEDARRSRHERQAGVATGPDLG